MKTKTRFFERCRRDAWIVNDEEDGNSSDVINAMRRTGTGAADLMIS